MQRPLPTMASLAGLEIPPQPKLPSPAKVPALVTPASLAYRPGVAPVLQTPPIRQPTSTSSEPVSQISTVMSTVVPVPVTAAAPTPSMIVSPTAKTPKSRRGRKRKVVEPEVVEDTTTYGDPADEDADEPPARKKHETGEILTLSVPTSGLTLAEAEVAVIVKECKEKIGEGKFSNVFLVSTTQGPVAVKHWRNQRRLTDEDIENIRNEADSIR